MISIIMPSLDPSISKIFFTLDNILKNKGRYEVVLVLQNTSSCKENEIKKKYADSKVIKVIKDSGIGISRARNIAIRASSGDWILLLDDDVYVDCGTIQHLAAQVSENSMLYYGNAMVSNTNSHYVRYYIVEKDLSIWSYNRVCSISLVINREVFDKVGLFDEDLGSGCEFGSSEESDFILRALLSEIQIKYMKDYRVYHDRAVHSLQKVESYAMGSGALYRKHVASKSLKLYIKFFLDLILRVIFLFSFQWKRYVFLKGFFVGFSKYGVNK